MRLGALPVSPAALLAIAVLVGVGFSACDASNTQDPGTDPGGSTSVAGAAPVAGTGNPSGGAPGMDPECADPTPPMPSPPAAGVNFPFPQNRATMCRMPSAPCLRKQNSQTYAAYRHWGEVFVTNQGAGAGLRVRRDASEGNDTVSEGIAYGMLITVYVGDRGTFDGLWTYAKAHMTGRGLMNWNIDANGAVKSGGANGASDADEDMAWALLMAAEQWGGSYLAEATTLINNIYAYEVDPATYIFKPGDMFGGPNLVNPSYLSPAYYRVFAEVTGQQGWMRVLDTSYQILNAAANPQTGLVPDWCTAAGAPAAGRSSAFAYDACRTPFRMALDYCWNGEPRALAYLNRVNAFFTPISPTAIKDGYTVTGAETGTRYGLMAFVSPLAVSAMADPNGAFTMFLNVAQATLATRTQSNDGANFSYYNASWGVIGMLVLSGNFVDYRRF